MKIVVVLHQFPVLSQTFVLDHVTGLLERGHDLRIFARRPQMTPEDLPEWKALGLAQRTRYWPRIMWHPLAWEIAAWIAAWKLPRASIRQALRQPLYSPGRSGTGRWMFPRAVILRRQLPGVAVVHAHFAKQGEELAWLRTLNMLNLPPLVLSLHGFDILRRVNGARPHYPNACRQVDRVVVTTGFMEEQAVAAGFPRERIVRIPCGVRAHTFAFKERHRVADEPVRLLTIARLVEKKGVEFAIRAVGKLVSNGVDVRYTVVGDGPLRESLETLVQHLGLVRQVRFTGALPRPEIAQHLANAQIYVMPSCLAADGDAEGQGIVAQEAQACGLPVLATRHGGIPEGVVEGESAVLVAERDADALATGLQEILSRHAQWPAMGRAGRTFVESNFSLELQLDRYERLYSELSAGAAVPFVRDEELPR